MRIKMFAAAAAAGLLFAGAAQAEVLQLSCSLDYGTTHISDGQSLSSSPTDTVPNVPVTLDFDRGWFALGSTEGPLAVAGNEVTAVARSDPYSAFYEIDRASGRLRGIGTVSQDQTTIFMRVFGQCRTQSGATRF